MKSTRKNRNKTLISDKIAEALTVKESADIEDDNVFNTKPKTVSREDFGSDSDEEAAISEFRKRNVNLLSDLSKKYEGEVVSRKDLEENSSEESDISSDGDELLNNISNGKLRKDSSESKNNAEDSDLQSDENSEESESDDYSITKAQRRNSSDAEEDVESEEEEEGIDISEMQEPITETFEHMKKQNVPDEVKKGVSVQNQLLLWENLLETRIHLQRCMNTANKMPMPECYKELKKDNNEFIKESNVIKANLTNILDKLLLLQDIQFKNFPDTKTISSGKSDKQDTSTKADGSDEEIPSDTDNEEIPSDTETEDMETTPNVAKVKINVKKRKLQDYEQELSQRHKCFKSFRDSTIQKWNEKTRLASAANLKNASTNTILQQINYILSDKEKLIHRTQLKRMDYDIVGYEKPELLEDKITTNKSRKDDDEYIKEIFDDTDFYHQLLRELIECKTSDISDPVQLSRQWIALQQMRSKMKRKVDTKATKGRRIKYVVHNKLVNFMAPEKNLTWTEESKSELYNSLFGKLFENGNQLDVDNSFVIKND